MIFGPEYPKIQTLFKRDDRNVIIEGDWSVPEFAYLADKPWRWTEKVDGTNIRLHWDGRKVTSGVGATMPTCRRSWPWRSPTRCSPTSGMPSLRGVTT